MKIMLRISGDLNYIIDNTAGGSARFFRLDRRDPSIPWGVVESRDSDRSPVRSLCLQPARPPARGRHREREETLIQMDVPLDPIIDGAEK